MILDFTPWRAELCERLDELNRTIDEYLILHATDAQKVGVSLKLSKEDSINFELERSLFYSAVVCRKMIEAAKWANTAATGPDGQPIRNLPDTIFEMTWSLTDAFGRSHSCSAKQILDEIIHSKEISWADQPSDGVFEGFWLASDRGERRGRLFIVWQEFKDLIRLFAGPPDNVISSN